PHQGAAVRLEPVEEAEHPRRPAHDDVTVGEAHRVLDETLPAEELGPDDVRVVPRAGATPNLWRGGPGTCHVFPRAARRAGTVVHPSGDVSPPRGGAGALTCTDLRSSSPAPPTRCGDRRRGCGRRGRAG